MPATISRPRSTREMERRSQRLQPKPAAPSAFGAAQKIVIRPAAGSSPEEELYLLGALEALRRRHDNLKITYAAENEVIVPLLRKRWFLADAAWCAHDRFFETLVGENFGATISEPDPEAAARKEAEIYEKEYQRRVTEIRAQQKAAIDAGVKDLVLPEPPHQFMPRWHKTNGYYWQLCEELGLPLTVPGDPIAPFGDLPAAVCKPLQQQLHREHVTRRPFVLYDFAGEASALPLMAMLAAALPDLELVSLAEVQRIAGHGLDALLAACAHAQCRYVAAPPGLLSCAAWAGGVPNILSLYTGANAQWEGPHPINLFTLNRDQFSDEQLPEAVRQALVFLVARANRQHAG